MPSRMPPTRIPSPVRAPSPTPSPVEAPAPSPIGRVVTSEIETGIPIVGAAPVTPRREIDGIDDDIPSHDGDVVEPRAVDAVHEESRVVVIVVITGRTDIVRVFEHAQPPQVGTFVSVAVTVYVAVRITVVYFLQYDAVLGVGQCQHGFDARTAGFRFGPFYFRLPAFGLRYGLPVMRPVHVVVIRGGGCGIAGSGTSGGQHGGESGQRRSQIFNHLSHSCKRYVMVPSFVMITQESVFCFVTRTAECIYKTLRFPFLLHHNLCHLRRCRLSKATKNIPPGGAPADEPEKMGGEVRPGPVFVPYGLKFMLFKRI